MEKRKGYRAFITLCLAPAVILFLIFMVVPTVEVFRMSLFKRSAYSQTETFVGLQNFKILLTDANFIRSMQNTILLIVVVTIVTFAFALVFAGILTREKIKGQNFFRVIFYIPNILSVVVISAIFSAIYDPSNGTLNGLLSLLSGKTVTVLWKGEKLIMLSLIIAMILAGNRLLYGYVYGGMANVPASLYESADLDGASRIRQFFQITIPLIWTKYPHDPDLLYYLDHQHGVPFCEGHDPAAARTVQVRSRCHICISRHTPTPAMATAWRSVRLYLYFPSCCLRWSTM